MLKMSFINLAYTHHLLYMVPRYNVETNNIGLQLLTIRKKVSLFLMNSRCRFVWDVQSQRIKRAALIYVSLCVYS